MSAVVTLESDPTSVPMVIGALHLDIVVGKPALKLSV